MFRKEALEYQKWKSTALLLSSIPSWLVFALSFVVTASFILYVTFGSYTRRETILGEVVMQPHPIVLSASKSGYISERYVNVNQRIKKGDPLFKITLDRITDSGNVGVNSINSMRDQIKKLNDIIELVKTNQRETLANLDKQIGKNRKIYADTKLYFDEVSKSTEEYLTTLRKYENLMKKGYSANDEVTLQRSRYFDQKSLRNNLQEKLIQQETVIINLENEIESRKTDFQNQIIRYELQQNDLEIRLMELESVSELIVNAPIDGVVESVSVTVGQIIKENDALAQVIPANKGEYQLVMWVPNSAISFIKPNDFINIRYEAFPFEKFGQFKGVISHISTLPASLQELAFYKNIPSADPNNPLYKIVVSITDQKVAYNDTSLYFLSGMKAEATIFLENRKLYEWMLFPLYSITKNMEEK
ncbi:HlyD family secretion protein [Rodentibacter caecimuris]|uniref:HlyD family secretion protein n=1 Tax=Rodentibacter caecimuris TaxID=1796644 RepID=UPI0022489566|nr:HlyD family efflux transporter periplasmic adaptor subunit [Rodentibacter heylii]MCX2962300.1 HlyD family secretion protein [Rodentibacter heylii]